MKIGSYTLKNNLILAPMAGVTDRPFRQLCRNLGAGMAVSEMVSSNSLLYGSKKTRLRADHSGEDEPRSVQIMGADPQMMADAAKYNADNGAQIIDINMGCPAKKVCKVAAGSALMQDEPLVVKILEAIVKAVDIPITLKIRTGWNRENKNAPEIARIAEESGIQALSIHGRTRADAYKGDAEYETIRLVKSQRNIPIIANGDITTPEKAIEVLQQTGADAIMIGRAAQGKPWIFRSILHYMETGKLLPEPELSEIQSLLVGHLHNLYDFYGERSGVRIARKHIAWYSKGQKHGAAFRQAVTRVESSAEQLQMTHDFFDALISSSPFKTPYDFEEK